MISWSRFVPNGYSNTSGAFAAFRLHIAKMCIWRSRPTAASRWPRKLGNLVSRAIYSRLTALLPRCFWAVGNTSWRTLLNWDSTRCWPNDKDDVILEVTDHFRNFQGRCISNKDKEIAKTRIFSEEQSIGGCAEELMAERNSQRDMARNTKAGRASKHKETMR